MENPLIRVDRLKFPKSNFGENTELEYKRPIDIYPYGVWDQRTMGTSILLSIKVIL